MGDEYGNLIDGSLLFQERYAMAQSQKNPWTKMVSTWKCINVSLTSIHLHVKLHGLFGWLVKPFGADLDHVIPIIDIRSIENRKNVLGYTEISVVFDLQSGGERELLLYLKRGEEFLNLLRSMMN
ncbi:MAG: hypothetical protein KAQ97_08860 [Candidatus Fermentibacteraceae bacterium]|nr:hypothetical protein [Candidatus Fermentibacteraceae bacterium]